MENHYRISCNFICSKNFQSLADTGRLTGTLYLLLLVTVPRWRGDEKPCQWYCALRPIQGFHVTSWPRPKCRYLVQIVPTLSVGRVQKYAHETPSAFTISGEKSVMSRVCLYCRNETSSSLRRPSPSCHEISQLRCRWNAKRRCPLEASSRPTWRTLGGTACGPRPDAAAVGSPPPCHPIWKLKQQTKNTTQTNVSEFRLANVFRHSSRPSVSTQMFPKRASRAYCSREWKSNWDFKLQFSEMWNPTMLE